MSDAAASKPEASMALRGLAGGVAVVTGGGGGLGEATVRRLLGQGAQVVAVDRDAAALAVLQEAVGSAALVTATADISIEDGAEAAMAEAVRAFGRLDFLVNNAALLGRRRLLADLDVRDFDAVIAVNVKGAFLCLRAGIRQMLAQGGGGAIVNVSSRNAMRPGSFRAAYNCSKSALVGLSNTAAREYGPHGIRVNAILPGAIGTAAMKRVMAEGASPQTLAEVATLPLGRMAEPDEVAAFICWLLSSESSYQTGGAFPIDGGASI